MPAVSHERLNFWFGSETKWSERARKKCTKIHEIPKRENILENHGRVSHFTAFQVRKFSPSDFSLGSLQSSRSSTLNVAAWSRMRAKSEAIPLPTEEKRMESKNDSEKSRKCLKWNSILFRIQTHHFPTLPEALVSPLCWIAASILWGYLNFFFVFIPMWFKTGNTKIWMKSENVLFALASLKMLSRFTESMRCPALAVSELMEFSMMNVSRLILTLLNFSSFFQRFQVKRWLSLTISFCSNSGIKERNEHKFKVQKGLRTLKMRVVKVQRRREKLLEFPFKIVIHPRNLAN